MKRPARNISIETEHLLLGLIREKGPRAGSLPIPPVPKNIRKDIEGRTVFPRKFDVGRIPFSAETKRVSTPRKKRSPPTATAPNTCCSASARRAIGGGDHPMERGCVSTGRGASCSVEPRSTASRKPAPRGVQPRPDRSGTMKNQLDPLVGRDYGKLDASAGAVPPHQEQRGADRRAGVSGPQSSKNWREDRLRRRAALLADSAARARVSRSSPAPSIAPVRRAPQGDHEGARRQPEHHRVHRRATHTGRADRKKARAANILAGAEPRRDRCIGATTGRISQSIERIARSSATLGRSRSIRRRRAGP